MAGTLEPEQFSDWHVSSAGFYPLQFSADIVAPSDFLAFARLDLGTEPDARALTNALGNAKRAIAAQVDLILEALGCAPSNRDSGLPVRLEVCRRLGIATPGILQRINAVRNALEHDYSVPARQTVSDAVDVAELFLVATAHILKKFPSSATLEPLRSRDSTLDLYLKEGGPIQATFTRLSPAEAEPSIKLEITPDDRPRYERWVRLMIAKGL